MTIKPNSVSVTINTPTNETQHEFKKFDSLDSLLSIIDANEPTWTSIVMVFCNPKTHN